MLNVTVCKYKSVLITISDLPLLQWAFTTMGFIPQIFIHHGKINTLVHHTYPFGWLGVSSVDRGVAWAEHYYLDSG